MRGPRLLVVVPAYQRGGRVLQTRKLLHPSLAPYYLAGVASPHAEVRVAIEPVDTIDEEWPDVVWISFLSAYASGAYAVADRFRARGTRVVLGGPHATVCPEEASTHGDVVAGEIETADIEFLLTPGPSEGRVIVTPALERLEGTAFPRYDLIQWSHYMIDLTPVWASRGCPMGCDFCHVTTVFGKKHRIRPCAEVVRDVEEAIERTGRRRFFFVDDNISMNESFMEQLCEALIPLRVDWLSQASITVAKNDRLVRLMARAGCRILFVGIERLEQEGLRSFKKNFVHSDQICQQLNTLRQHGVLPMVSLIVGMEHDTQETVDKYVRFLYEINAPFAFLWVLTPLPRTKLYDRLKDEGRIGTTGVSWDDCDGLHAALPLKISRTSSCIKVSWKR